MKGGGRPSDDPCRRTRESAPSTMDRDGMANMG
uniref:Uncharacterized protein n=2 Tax=unclassified Caudoviricetes TaxID=2788787 RepID=A0A8S5M1E2_9CAUD|nr:MAG TPA: hypothetical protein [Myoviridae sp. ctyFl19]DAE06166.1 MAG TPA: hypothetical protein [Myoviridae sp. ctdSc46]